MAEDIAFISFNSIPEVNASYKYLKLGNLALKNHKAYCQQHGYTYISNVTIDKKIPACWSKIPAIIDALKYSKWVIWADSDTLIANNDIRLEQLLNPKKDIISQCPVSYFAKTSVSFDQRHKIMPLNTGVFMVQNTQWTIDFLSKAFQLRPVESSSGLWDGIGEQEAMIQLLNEMDNGFEHVDYTRDLQSHPKFYNDDIMFIHFYGNYASKRLTNLESETIISKWEQALYNNTALPEDRIRFHYACIQNFIQNPIFNRRNPEYFLYTEKEITYA